MASRLESPAGDGRPGPAAGSGHASLRMLSRGRGGRSDGPWHPEGGPRRATKPRGASRPKAPLEGILGHQALPRLPRSESEPREASGESPASPRAPSSRTGLSRINAPCGTQRDRSTVTRGWNLQQNRLRSERRFRRHFVGLGALPRQDSQATPSANSGEGTAPESNPLLLFLLIIYIHIIPSSIFSPFFAGSITMSHKSHT